MAKVRCQKGKHWWEVTKPGRPPVNCPEHQTTTQKRRALGRGGAGLSSSKAGPAQEPPAPPTPEAPKRRLRRPSVVAESAEMTDAQYRAFIKGFAPFEGLKR